MPTRALSLNWPLRRVTPSNVDPVIAAAMAGERSAYDLLLERYRDRILNLCFQILRDRDAAEDATQEAFLRAFEKLSEFRAESDFGTWLYKVALTTSLQKQRKNERHNRLAPTEDAVPDVPAPGDFGRKIETRLAVEQVLDSLSPKLRTVLVLREWHGLSYDEISSITEIPVGTVRSRLFEARQQFRDLWEEMK